ncbi:MAG TPA: NAD(P)H-dependent oxidoreductase [Kofleriaceae bacterium]|nr:NAD(P)H-dependent oxidoreductase [Kofleriaceae bacterium]
MSEPLRIGIVLGSTRQGRFSERAGAWLLERAARHVDVAFERVDLRDYPLPFFDEPRSPLREPSRHPVAVRWSAKVASLDGFVFVHGEYNHGIPASLKNALDYLYAEWNRKPCGSFSYGNAGGARGVEQLRANAIELQMAPVRHAVHLSGTDYLDVVLHGKELAEVPRLEAAADLLLADLLWWARALRTARTAT